MTTTQDAVSSAPPVRRQPVALCVAVGGAVAVCWLLYRHYWAADVYDRIFRWDWIMEHFWAVTLVYALALCVPYALALLLWGRTLSRSIAGALTAVGAGVYLWGWDRVFDDLVWGSDPATNTSLRVYVWGSLLGVAALVPLAWGVARRTGRAWVLGILVGPVVAAVLRELQVRWTWWHDHVRGSGTDYRWQYEAAVFVAPFVLAALACWAIEARGRRTPEMGSSA